MKWLLILLCPLLLLSACGSTQQNEKQERRATKEDSHLENQENEDFNQITIKNIGEAQVINISEFVQTINGNVVYNPIHRTVRIEIGDDIFKMVYGVPVVEKNGLYLPMSNDLYILEDEVYLPIQTLTELFDLTVISTSNDLLVFNWEETTKVSDNSEIRLLDEKDWTVATMIEYLSFLNKPIEEAKVSTIPNHLPGAKRAYRNGYHEGIDWYAYATGNHISTETPVYAMAEGIVVRADHDYEEYPSVDVRNQDLTLTAELGETPEYIFDRLRGRQVWVQYEKGVMNRFAHLDSIPRDLQVGDRVSSSTIIGYVGNSGTSGAVKKDGSQLHLHQDILIYGELFWKPFSPEEVKKIVVGIFGD